MNFTCGLIQTGSKFASLSLLCAACFSLASSALGAVGGETLTMQDITKGDVVPAIQEAIVRPAPSDEMFADQVRVNGLKLLAQHHVEEGIRGCVDYLLAQNPWASELRAPEILETLLKYGGHARRINPRLQGIAANFDKGEPDFPLSLRKKKAAAARDAIAGIEASQARPELKRVTL